MQRFFNKYILIAIAALLIVGLVAVGCAKATPTPAPTATPARGATPTPLPTATPVPVKPIVMKAVSYGATPDFNQRWIQERAMDLVVERSGGRIKFDYYPHNQLIAAANVFDAVRTNLVQMGVTWALYEPDRMPLLAMMSVLPFKTHDPVKFAQYYRQPGGLFEFQAPYWEKYGIKQLAMPITPFGELFFSKPVTKLEDFKGKLIRVPATLAPILTAMGATQNFLQLTDLYTGLQRGTIDGAAITLGGALDLKLNEVAPYMPKLNFYSGHISSIMNLEFLNSLPPDLQKIIMDSFAEVELKWNRDLAMADYEKDLKRAEAAGVKVWTPSKEELLRFHKVAETWFDTELKNKFPKEWPEVERFVNQLTLTPK